MTGFRFYLSYSYNGAETIFSYDIVKEICSTYSSLLKYPNSASIIFNAVCTHAHRNIHMIFLCHTESSLQVAQR